MKLTITGDCRWDKNTKNLVVKGNSRLWFLRRLNLIKASQATIFDIYNFFCHAILEYRVPFWAGSIIKKNKTDIERVKRNAMKIIFGTSDNSYTNILESVGEVSLMKRRENLSLKFTRNVRSLTNSENDSLQELVLEVRLTTLKRRQRQEDWETLPYHT